MSVNPLLRRLQVLPPESYEDRSYGDMIQRKRKKYASGTRAFGVEGFVWKDESLLVKIGIIAFLVILIFIFLYYIYRGRRR